MNHWSFEHASPPIRLEDLELAPVSEVPADMFTCGRCDAVLWLAGQMPVLHDCESGEVVPA